MKKILIIGLLFLTFSCKKQNAEILANQEDKTIYQDNQILGKWVYSTIKINGVLSIYRHHATCSKDYFTFRNKPSQDHQYEEDVFYPSPGNDCTLRQTFMVWKLKGENLILSFGKTDFVYKILRLTDTNFDISIKIDYDNDGKLDDVELYSIKGNCPDNSTYCPI